MTKKVKGLLVGYFAVLGLGLMLLGHILFNYDVSLKIYFLDVGQGDATLIKTPDNRYVLIDGGPDHSVIYKLGKYLPFYVRTIDLVVVTHPDNDHVVGLNEVIRRYRVKNILLTGVADESLAYQNILALAKEFEINFFIAGLVNRLELADQINLAVLYPRESIVDQDFTQDNDWSIVNRLDYRSGCVLLMGDATKKVEQNLLVAKSELECDILKVGHHGSNTSSGVDFLRSVNPALAVISAGQNNYGHPHQAVIDRLNAFKIRFLTTKDYGDIIVTLEKNGSRID